ncbi:centromere protein Q [Silurus asotus]|uniref:Centromere protein Q n=1 Tax=Silurus asotus TaxID=30991 RepID=A0AAD5FV52_SILAS|nr:centromere protein Q [Silurus asotus]
MKPARGSSRASTRGPKAAGRVEPRKVKGREKWKPLTKSSIMVLDNMLSLSILFMAKCSHLPVPPQKRGNMMHMSQQIHKENQMVKHGKKKIEELEESSQAVVSALELLQVKMDRLERECKVMRDKLKDEESNAQQFFQLTEQAVLHLPVLSLCEDEPTLQDKIMNAVADPKAVINALQERNVTANAKAFLELAHKQIEQL